MHEYRLDGTYAYHFLSSSTRVPTMVSTSNDQVDKAAMMTAEAPFNSMRSTISGQPSTQGSKSDTGKEESTNMGKNPNPDSDLAALLKIRGMLLGSTLAGTSCCNLRRIPDHSVVGRGCLEIDVQEQADVT
ncbi:hypothetical protein Zm00014a_028663 [Zea mays]|uniref:Uncharacterized protein n=1 Tax=Zea mays TaxID=4577 RepID=A0A3L6DHU9_MAIZE|nr:hypothetical protein Zm00014a_028663 [Zea mays]